MNTNDSKSSKNSKQPSENPAEKEPGELTSPIPPPLSSKPDSDESAKKYTTEPLDTARIAGGEKRSSEGQTQKEREAFEEKNRQTSRNNSKKTDDFYTYATSNREQTITYILLILGLLLLLFFNNLLGGLIIGMVAGYYFSSEIVYYIRNLSQVVGGQSHLRYIVLTALLLGLFIAAPGIFIGAIIVATFKQVMLGPRDPSNRKQT